MTVPPWARQERGGVGLGHAARRPTAGDRPRGQQIALEAEPGLAGALPMQPGGWGGAAISTEHAHNDRRITVQIPKECQSTTVYGSIE
jgi:hypothetical protein